MTSDPAEGERAEPGPQPRYLPIAEHGLIGDLHTVALVGTNGTIDWYCCPSFDSPSVFGAILDADRGGCRAHDQPARTTRWRAELGLPLRVDPRRLPADRARWERTHDDIYRRITQRGWSDRRSASCSMETTTSLTPPS